jgi:XTP/dITP diphosphohydrolase
VVRVTLASRNAHKARELEALLPGWTIEPLDVDDWPDETGSTYYENALGKASFARAARGGWALGEDSGIEVAALGGRPGLHSARYAPEGAPAIAKLLAELGDAEDRRARYVSELVLAGPDGAVLRGTGTVVGRIAAAPRGTGGFGYDPLFLVDGDAHGRTMAELAPDEKNRISHRARALARLVELLPRR